MGRAGDGGLRTILERTGIGNREKAADTPGVGNAGLDVVQTLASLAEAGAPPVVAQVGEAGIVDLQMDASGIRVMMMEVGLLTPPAAPNIYVAQYVDGEASVMQVINGTLPFYITVLGLTVLLAHFPMIAMWLPGTMR